MLDDLDLAITNLDNIFIKSRNREEPVKHGKLVLKKIKNAICLTIKYLGHIIDEKGRKPDTVRSTVINNMPLSTSVSKWQAFWGFVNYYSNIIPKIHSLRAP